MGAANQLTASSATFRRLDAIDGLRGLAALAVVCHHIYFHGGQFDFPLLPFRESMLPPSRILFYGYCGVDLFFAVSGFCLTYPLLIRTKPVDWRLWFTKRAVRILPPYYASFFLFWLMTWFLHHYTLTVFGASSKSYLLPDPWHFVHDFALINLYFNASYWTLDVEVRWYLIFPLMYWCWRRATAPLMLAGSTACAWVAINLNSELPRFEMLIGTMLQYLPTFALGMFAAARCARSNERDWLDRNARWFLVVLVFLIAVAHPLPPEFPSSHAVRVGLFAAGAFFLITAVLADPLFARIASSRPFVTIGRFSYSLYLIHEPFIHAVYDITRQFEWSEAFQFAFYIAVVLPTCVGLGYMFYLAVEQPTLRLLVRMSAKGA